MNEKFNDIILFDYNQRFSPSQAVWTLGMRRGVIFTGFIVTTQAFGLTAGKRAESVNHVLFLVETVQQSSD